MQYLYILGVVDEHGDLSDSGKEIVKLYDLNLDLE